MALDLSKLTDAVAKVAELAKAAADASALVTAANAARDAAVADLTKSQADVDALTASLIAATTTPAEAVGLAAVSAAVATPAPLAPVAPEAVIAAIAPVAGDMTASLK